MKNIVRTVLCFGLFFILSIGKTRAIEPLYQVQIDKEIKIIPTAVPTIAVIKPIKEIELDIKPLATKTPTPVVVTQIITATPNPTATTTEDKIAETEKISIEPKTEEIKEETKVVETEDEGVKNKNSDKLFWIIIVGLLVLILAIQVWSTKKDEERQIKK